MSPTVARAEQAWGGVLAALEEHVAAQVAFVASDGELQAPAPYLPPTDLPPIPEALAPRARRLLDTIELVSTELGAERDRVAGELARLPRLRNRTGPDPEHLDLRA